MDFYAYMENSTMQHFAQWDMKNYIKCTKHTIIYTR